MLVEEIAERLGEEVDALASRVEGAAELTAMVTKGALPNVTPWAYVLPLGLQPRDDGEAATGAFLQEVNEIVGVVLIVRSAGDPSGRKALPAIDALVAAVVAALAGWAPTTGVAGAPTGVFSLSRGALLSANSGVVIYQLDFAIQTQLRNLS